MPAPRTRLLVTLNLRRLSRLTDHLRSGESSPDLSKSCPRRIPARPCAQTAGVRDWPYGVSRPLDLLASEHELARRSAARGGRCCVPASRTSSDRGGTATCTTASRGDGYYRNGFDYSAVSRLLLEPAGVAGSGACALSSIDTLTQIDHSSVTTSAPHDAVLIVDGVFGFRPEINAYWDYRIWLQSTPRRRCAEAHSETAGGQARTQRSCWGSLPRRRAAVRRRSGPDATGGHRDRQLCISSTEDRARKSVIERGCRIGLSQPPRAGRRHA
jgi:hypothetical protein